LKIYLFGLVFYISLYFVVTLINSYALFGLEVVSEWKVEGVKSENVKKVWRKLRVFGFRDVRVDV